jgi:hypothetical protein
MRQPGAALIAHYLDPDRLPVSKRWSRKHAHLNWRRSGMLSSPGRAVSQEQWLARLADAVEAAARAKRSDAPFGRFNRVSQNGGVLRVPPLSFAADGAPHG